MMRALILVLGVSLAGCAIAPVASLEAGPRMLTCRAPMRIDLAPLPSGTNAGVPAAGIAWSGDHCMLAADENAPGIMLVVADFAGSVFMSLVAASADDWVIAQASIGSAPTTHLSPVPRDTDITIALDRDGVRVAIVFRVEGQTLVLVSMHLA